MRQPNLQASDAIIISAQQHGIDSEKICIHAQQIIQQLAQAGHEAYLVGGALRDLILGKNPKDFDVATSATPDQLVALFPRCRRIGRRFQLVHVYSGRNYTEVSTFRAATDQQPHPDRITNNGLIVRDNVYGTAREDALRRDFTINALFYDVQHQTIIDYCGGFEDLKSNRLRTIGPAVQRFQEDPVRMLRALRFQAKLNIDLCKDIQAAIVSESKRLTYIPPARLLDESIKMFHGGCALTCWDLLGQYGLLETLFPQVVRHLQEKPAYADFVTVSLQNSDLRIKQNKPLNPAFVFAVILWPELQFQLKRKGRHKKGAQAFQMTALKVIREQSAHIAIPKRMALVITEIWSLQNRFRIRHGKRAMKLMQHPKFRAAYDFMCLRAKTGELKHELCEWWTTIQTLPPDEQQAMLTADHNTPTNTIAIEN